MAVIDDDLDAMSDDLDITAITDDRGDEVMRDAEAVDEEKAQYGSGAYIEEDLDEKYPNRPHNHAKTLPFSDLYLTLFKPLMDNKRSAKGVTHAHKKQKLSPHEARTVIVERFISRWRTKVGNDIYPAFRLIVPEKDRDRAMYGLKEKTIGKLLVSVMGIDKHSEDAFNLLNWKLPGVKATSAMAGDFAGRCYEIISKRATRQEPGGLSIGTVNEMLDRLSIAQKEVDQLPIFREFYNNMNADELLWLIRMILRQMKVGATEKTIFQAWHPDAENLFNVSSSLRRVCWELYDSEVRLEGDKKDINLMQCFQPQLAAFQMHSMEKIVDRMHLSDDDPVFWIEEKLDGERMQLHMEADDSQPGGFRFSFWSRKGKDYTYLYGRNFEDKLSSLTRHIRSAFNPDVRNIILDGEMITWDYEEDTFVAFGHLKTAAISEQRDPYAGKWRPLFKVFDCLYLNDQVLTQYTLRDRRRALEQSVNSVHRRLEIHEYTEAQSSRDIEKSLQKVVAESTEGLVVKRPNSMYRLNQRNDDWVKVKPEYMAEFGQSLDCVVIGGYYGSGRRGGILSSFMCGLRMDPDYIAQHRLDPQFCKSFFKVGGGFSASDYRDIRHRTDGKWEDWDRSSPPNDFIELGGMGKQFERPDVWIKPEDSVVLEVKAAQVISTPQFATMCSLRFPRFTRIRSDKSWKEALSMTEFKQLEVAAKEEKNEKQFKIDDARKQRRAVKSKKKQLVVVGSEPSEDVKIAKQSAGPALAVFKELTFYIITSAARPINKSKVELEQLVKSHGGSITQTHKDPSTICIAEGNPVRVASLKKDQSRNLIRPKWLLDCISQAVKDSTSLPTPLPIEPQHVLFATPEDCHNFEHNVDLYGDSFARDATTEDLRHLLETMPEQDDTDYDAAVVLDELLQQNDVFDDSPGWMFHGLRVVLARDTRSDLEWDAVRRIVLLCGGSIAESLNEKGLTHVVVAEEDGSSTTRELRRGLAK